MQGAFGNGYSGRVRVGDKRLPVGFGAALVPAGELSVGMEELRVGLVVSNGSGVPICIDRPLGWSAAMGQASLVVSQGESDWSFEASVGAPFVKGEFEIAPGETIEIACFDLVRGLWEVSFWVGPDVTERRPFLHATDGAAPFPAPNSPKSPTFERWNIWDHIGKSEDLSLHWHDGSFQLWEAIETPPCSVKLGAS
jgi:hypothetical protein